MVTGNAGDGGMTISALAEEIRNHLRMAGEHGTVELFESRLAATGLDDASKHLTPSLFGWGALPVLRSA